MIIKMLTLVKRGDGVFKEPGCISTMYENVFVSKILLPGDVKGFFLFLFLIALNKPAYTLRRVLFCYTK